jgi:hypothetical protein
VFELRYSGLVLRQHGKGLLKEVSHFLVVWKQEKCVNVCEDAF